PSGGGGPRSLESLTPTSILFLPPPPALSHRDPFQKWNRGTPECGGGGLGGCPRDRQPPERPAFAGNMGVLRAGLCPGLTEEIVQLLRGRRIKTVADLAAANLEEVAQKCSLSYKALVALRRVLLAQFSAFPLNGADLYEELKTSTAILSTGIGSLDKLLDTGLYTGEVTEIAGGPGSGKTQVCLCVAANVAHSLQQNVLYVDANGGMTASRLLQLLQARTQDEEKQAGALQRIQVAHAFDIFRMLDMLQDLRGAMAQQVTNHLTRDRDGKRFKPALGRSWSFVPSTRILLDVLEGAGTLGSSQRTVCLTKSPRQPTGLQEVIDIGTLGIEEQSPELLAKQT
ncbi:DNA repair protein RAD51 homolog 4, partial [Lemmus lemmus]